MWILYFLIDPRCESQYQSATVFARGAIMLVQPRLATSRPHAIRSSTTYGIVIPRVGH
jgi:hypothetical protein